MDLMVKGKMAFVVASSEDLGKAIAKKFALEGANVILVNFSEDKLQRSVEDI